MLIALAIPAASLPVMVDEPKAAVGIDSHSAECLGLAVLCVESEGDVTNNVMKDVYRFVAPPGTDYEVRVDTTSFATAFDPWVRVCTGFSGNTLSGCFAAGDDNFACTFAPPAYSCPRVAGTLPTARTATWFVAVAAHPCCGGTFRTPGLGEYNVEVVALGGVLTLEGDNSPGN